MKLQRMGHPDVLGWVRRDNDDNDNSTGNGD